MSIKKKIIVISVSVFAAILAIVVIILFGPIPMNVDWENLPEINSNVVLLEAGVEHNPTDAPALVKMNGDAIDTSDWKVLQFTDMHLSETNEGDLGNDRTIKMFVETIERESPDFVAFTGDIITSISGRARAIQLCEMMEKMGVYWAYCLGNHEGDAIYKMPRKELMQIIEKYPHCLSDASKKYVTKSDGSEEEVWGIGNFVVNLLGADYKVVQSMIFMDSGDAIAEEDYEVFKAQGEEIRKKSYDYLKDSQKAWYEEQVKKVTEDLTNGVKTMLFIHIPLVEQRNMKYVALNSLEEGWTEEVAAEGWSYVEGVTVKDHDGNVVGKVALKDGWYAAKGSINYEGVCCSDHNNNMYDLMKSLRAGVNGLFCGHDHANDAVLYEAAGEGETPIYLCYGICGGYATYNLYKNNKTDDPTNLMKGYSVITIHGDSTFDYTGVSWDRYFERTVYVENSLPKA